MWREKKFVLSLSLKIPDPNLLFESPRPLSPPQGELLSTYLEIDPLNLGHTWTV